jgi:hypothetical protein
MTWYDLFEDATTMREPSLLSSLVAGELDERRLIRETQLDEWSLNGRLARWVKAIWVRRPESGRRRPLTPESYPVRWQTQMQTH